MLWRLFVAWALVAIFAMCLSTLAWLGVTRLPINYVSALVFALLIVGAFAAVVTPDE